ncbi:MAG: hypothetical protein JWM44_2108 [Bacilli bacterium]|nr:hypothetical protein [Bacilli bacterium]
MAKDPLVSAGKSYIKYTIISSVVGAVGVPALILILLVFIMALFSDPTNSMEHPEALPYYYDAGLQYNIDWAELLVYNETIPKSKPTQANIIDQAKYLSLTKAQKGFDDEQLYTYLFRSKYKADDLISTASSFKEEFSKVIFNHRFPIHINESYNIQDTYGMVIKGLWDKPHNGTDISASKDTNLWAVSAGTVVKMGSGGEGGTAITIQDATDPSKYYYYAHLDHYAPGIYVGMPVQLNTIIGNVGMTGHATGDHVHFMVFLGDEDTNPMWYLKVWEAFDQYYRSKNGQEWKDRDYPPPPPTPKPQSQGPTPTPIPICLGQCPQPSPQPSNDICIGTLCIHQPPIK